MEGEPADRGWETGTLGRLDDQMHSVSTTPCTQWTCEDNQSLLSPRDGASLLGNLNDVLEGCPTSLELEKIQRVLGYFFATITD